MALHRSSLRRAASILLLAVGALAAGSAAPPSAMAQATPAAKMQHTASLSNIVNNFTKIDNALFNGNPNAVLLVQPFGVPKQVGVFYDATSSRWAVFNEDKSAMAVGARFTVVADGGFVHRSSAANSTAGWTWIDSPVTNNAPMAVVFITQRWNQSGANGGYNDRGVGVWYDPVNKKWAIYNEDRSPMGAGLEFNVKVFATNASASTPAVNIWRTGPGNVGSPTTISPTRVAGGGLFILTHTYNPGNVGGTYLAAPWGVSTGTSGNWQVVSSAPIPNDLAFNVLTY